MKKILTSMLLTAGLHPCLAQEAQFKKGQIDLQVGIGFISTLYENNSALRDEFKSPPISFSADYGITDELSFGAYFASAQSTVHFLSGGYDFNLGDASHVIIGGTGQYHYQLLPQLDTYVGGMLGYNILSAKDNGTTTAQKSGFTLAANVGGRYYLTKNIGAFVELGYGVSLVAIGATLRIP